MGETNSMGTGVVTVTCILDLGSRMFVFAPFLAAEPQGGHHNCQSNTHAAEQENTDIMGS
eukprot:3351271-Prymnesium_polylepis.2